MNTQTGQLAIGIAMLLFVADPALANEKGAPKSTVAQDKAPGITIIRNGSQPSIKGPSDWFTGTVRIDPLFLKPMPRPG